MLNRAGLWCLVTAITALAASGCDSETGPTKGSVAISMPTPPPGAVIPIVQNGSQYFLARGSGMFSIPITVTAGREVPYAQLSVYLYEAPRDPLQRGFPPVTGDLDLGYCGQNLPDAPTWGPFLKDQTATVSISGFQFSKSPCNVASIKVFLHTRNNGTLTPPNDSETVVQGSLAVNYTFR
jgi:hypothetical protein